MDIAVILPTYNERDNIHAVLGRLSEALAGRRWEAIFVDDDSPDGTAEVVAQCAAHAANVRLIHRVGRRGLSSACIEGMLATQAQTLVVMDADLQHDERILPAMLDRLHAESLDLVIATRNAEGGSMGEFCRSRVLLSRLGQRISGAVCRSAMPTVLSDPMSGFFALRRSFLLEVVRDLEGGGFKILVDLLSSARRPVRTAEVGYTFRPRLHGSSKLDLLVGVEYLSMICNKLLGDVLPVGLLLYLLVGTLGLLTHFAVLGSLLHYTRLPFSSEQAIAAFIAMSENFLLNNRITFRDRRLRGARMLAGAAGFAAICSFGAWADVVLSTDLLKDGVAWYVAGFAGILLGSVWNLSMGGQFTWRVRRHRPRAVEEGLPRHA